jgi:hypothetical protein
MLGFRVLGDQFFHLLGVVARHEGIEFLEGVHVDGDQSSREILRQLLAEGNGVP